MSTKISQLISATDITSNDLIQIVDIEDNGMAPSGTNKKATASLVANQLIPLINDGAIAGSKIAPNSFASNAQGALASSAVQPATLTNYALTSSLGVLAYEDTVDPTSAQIVTALGYTPANVASPTLTGHVKLSGQYIQTLTDESAMTRKLSDERYAQTRYDDDIALRGLRNLCNTYMGTNPVSVITLGDSFAIGALQLESIAKYRGSYRTGPLLSGGDNGVTKLTAQYTKSPDGIYFQITTGGWLTCGYNQTGSRGPADRVYYTLYPGTGVANLEYTTNGTTWVTMSGGTFDTANTAIVPADSVKIGSVPIASGFLGSVAFRLRASGGTVNGWLGQGCDGPGFVDIMFGSVGQGIHQSASISDTIWKAMVTGYSADLIVSAFADGRYGEGDGIGGLWPQGTDLWAVNGPMDTLRSHSKTAVSTVDWLIIGGHRVDPTRLDAQDATLDALYSAIGIGRNTDLRLKSGVDQSRLWALRNGEAFSNCYDLWPSYADAQADGMYGDPIHLNDKGRAYNSAAVINGTNLGLLFDSTAAQSSVRVGSMELGATRTFTGSASMAVYNTLPVPTLASILASEFRVSVAGSESSWWKINVTSSALRFGTSGGDVIHVDPYGIRPVTSGGASSGFASFPWAQTYTNGLATGFVEKTADYTLTPTDHTVLCTGSPSTITLPLAWNTQDYAITGKMYIIKNATTGVVTVMTTNDSFAVPQKIDAAATFSIAQGQTLRVQSAGELTSGNYNNYIII